MLPASGSFLRLESAQIQHATSQLSGEQCPVTAYPRDHRQASALAPWVYIILRREGWPDITISFLFDCILVINLSLSPVSKSNTGKIFSLKAALNQGNSVHQTDLLLRTTIDPEFNPCTLGERQR